MTIFGVIKGQDVKLAAFAQLTAVGNESKEITNAPANLKVKWVITGTTPDFTFSVHVSRQ